MGFWGFGDQPQQPENADLTTVLQQPMLEKIKIQLIQVERASTYDSEFMMLSPKNVLFNSKKSGIAFFQK